MSSLHIVCPYCQTINRLPSERLAEKPHCGTCKQALFAGRPSKLTASNFDFYIEQHDIPVVVDFWAPWCEPCKTMTPAFEQAALRLEPWVRFGKVNTEQERSLAAQYQIRSIPLLILFKSGRELARQSGAMNTSDIMSWVNKHL